MRKKGRRRYEKRSEYLSVCVPKVFVKTDVEMEKRRLRDPMWGKMNPRGWYLIRGNLRVKGKLKDGKEGGRARERGEI